MDNSDDLEKLVKLIVRLFESYISKSPEVVRFISKRSFVCELKGKRTGSCNVSPDFLASDLANDPRQVLHCRRSTFSFCPRCGIDVV
jgi:hypothetical protein